jgi:hypothetical protein
LYDADEHHNNGNDEQNMDQAAHGIGSNDSEQPQHYQDYANCPQHNFLQVNGCGQEYEVPVVATMVNDLI